MDCEPERLGKSDSEYRKMKKPIKPILLSSKKFKQLQMMATDTDASFNLKQREEEEKKLEKSRLECEDLILQFSGGTIRNKDQQIEAMRTKVEQRLLADNLAVMEAVKQSKANLERKRQDKVDAARKMIQRVKPGPRSLNTAAIHSEILCARNIQVTINKEFDKHIKAQASAYKMDCAVQNQPGVCETQERIAEKQEIENLYRKSLLENVMAKRQQIAEDKKKEILEAKEANAKLALELKAEIEKEKLAAEKKKAILRQNLVEARKMAEFNRKKEQLIDSVEDRLCCVYNTGKYELDKMNTVQVEKRKAKRRLMLEAQMKKLADSQNKDDSKEAERLQRDIIFMENKFEAEEQKKLLKILQGKKELKGARIIAVEEEKAKKLRDIEQKRFDMAERFKNDEVNCFFHEATAKEHKRKTEEQRLVLKQQREEKEKAEKAAKAANVCDDDEYFKEHKFFFEHARRLMEDAKKKNRSLYPFIKVVNQYKRDHKLNCVTKTPEHLISSIKLGLRQPGDSEADAKYAAKQSNENVRHPTDKEQMLIDCIKITELIEGERPKSKDQANCGLQCPNGSKHDGRQADFDEHTEECAKSIQATLNKMRKTTNAPTRT